MKRILLALLLSPGLATAEVDGMALRISCGTLIDATNGDLPTTANAQSYLSGLIDGIAISHGVTIPSQMPEMRRRILTACRNDPASGIQFVINADDFNQ